MTKEEKAELELQRAHARLRCKEVYGTIVQIKDILSDYYRDYYRWKDRFDKADHELAMEEKLTKLPGPGERREKRERESIVKLTKQQILEIAEVLEVQVELNFDDEDEEEVSENGDETEV